MKMDVLSVPNQFQRQFGGIGLKKIKDCAGSVAPQKENKNMRSISSRSSRRLPTNKLLEQSSCLSLPPKTAGAVNSHTFPMMATLPISPTQFQSSSVITDEENSASINALSLRLQEELRAAKSRHLACTEVLLPADLLHRVAAEMIKISEVEPCGIRGCSVYIEFEEDPTNIRRIAAFKVDPNTVSTFELYLILSHDKSSWLSILPQFLKNLARSSTILISPEFTLSKNKLYHSFSD